MIERRLAILLLLLATLLAYGNALDGSFHYDDVPPIVESPVLHDLSNWAEILVAQRGLGLLTFSLNYTLGGLDVAGYHLFNLLIHAGNAILVYFLCTALWPTPRNSGTRDVAVVPFFAALIFAVHPLQTQAVTYIVQRLESMAAMFVLVGLLCFIAAVRATDPSRRRIAYLGTISALFVGFWVKETAIVLPLLVLLIDGFWLAEGDWRQIWRRRWMHGLLLACMLLLVGKTLHLLGGATGAVKSTAGFAVSSINSWEYLLTQSNVVLYYLSLLFLPINQNLDYDFPVARDLFSQPQVREGAVLNWPPLPPILAIGVILLLLGVALAYYWRTRKSGTLGGRVVLFGLLWFLIAVAPTSSFIPVLDVIYEHRVYLSSLGVILIVVFSLREISLRLFGAVTGKERGEAG